MKFFIIYAFAVITFIYIDAKLPRTKEKIIDEVKVNEKEYERAKSVHEKWYIQAVNSVMGAIGREMYLKMGRFERRTFLNCLDQSGGEKDLQSGAECVIHAHDKTLHKLKRRRRKRSAKPNLLKAFVMKNHLDRPVTSQRLQRLRRQKNDGKELETFRKSYHKKIRNKGTRKNNGDTTKINRKERLSVRINDSIQHRKSYEDWLSDATIRTVDGPPTLMGTKDEKSPVKRVTNLISTMLQRKPGWKRISDKLKHLNDLNLSSKNQNKYGYNIKDIVTDHDPKYRKKLPFSKRFRNLMPTSDDMPKVLKGAFDLANTMEKHSDMMNAKVLSPRFMPIVDNLAVRDTVHLLSPNILPFYKDDSPNSIMPIPDIIDSTGIKPDDREAVLELVMQMSGAQAVVEDTFKIFKTKETATLLEDVDKVTNEVEKLFETLKGTFSNRQRRELAHQKFTFMDKKQLGMMYGPNGAFNGSLEGFSIDEYSKWRDEDKKKVLLNDLRAIVDDQSVQEGGNRRRKKRELSLMAPFVFSPDIMLPAVLGPVILSPNLFSPLILSPALLSPVLISPNIASPLIISPFMLSPNILSPGIWQVFVLSPYFISPNILNPFLMSPIILSPHMLCPDIMSPTLLSGAILNPYFLSPAVFTESALAIDILSPSFMSKRKKRKKKK